MKKNTQNDIEENRARFNEMAGYPLTDNQVLFCLDAEDAGFRFIPHTEDEDEDKEVDLNRTTPKKELDFTYSGRSMYGAKCPSVDVDDVMEVPTSAKVKIDGSGYGYVVYAQF